MKKRVRIVHYDYDLGIETYRFENMKEHFSDHFHEHYVIGFVEEGSRNFICRGREYEITKGDIVLINPGDSHSCSQKEDKQFDYISINISQYTMRNLFEAVTGSRELLGFSDNVIKNEQIAERFRVLYQAIIDNDCGNIDITVKSEYLKFTILLLIQKYGQNLESCHSEIRKEIENACEFLQENYSSKIYLQQMCEHTSLSKTTLNRAFKKSKGMTPYRYLENIRINKARNLLMQGITPSDAAIQAGFYDQSHFTNVFNDFIGLTPGLYRHIFFKDMEADKDDGE